MNKSKSSNFSKPIFSPLSDQKRFSDRRSSQTKRPSYRQPASEPHLTETTLGGVKVVVKSSRISDKPNKKKTGALSPRAPEKIKKNRAEEMKIFGENACLSLFEQRPESIVRVWATVEVAHRIGEMLSYLATNKKVYHVVDREELELVSGSEHHGGICMLVKKPRIFTLAGYVDLPRKADCLIMLDGVANNPQNLGGILRTCAFYGVKGIVTSQPDMLLNANTARVAEGGLEYVHILQSHDGETALQQLRQAGYQIVHISHEKQVQSINSLQLQDKVVFVLANGWATKEDAKVNLSLANPLKSGLNVAVATGVLLVKWVGR
ncbi:TrmH family RNA methyltransferase [Lonepinella koalarum]|uniref:TrmH RNA methyltransferase n=1 Tax=Lonepinella koalarum TaxID=53417 RepID=A0A4R1KQ59_9PAST|nr:TrmH family RNA methyltransferase [Lonepinella koalarum]MDH2925690.1 rRNA methyltransferase [Lonepinella koalarum]TCK67112.1 TrmH RNA methyltransferase [Lonepinella koalarum]TFJ88899.1 rRNA methyltransferase [Lonepinella koalarum]